MGMWYAAVLAAMLGLVCGLLIIAIMQISKIEKLYIKHDLEIGNILTKLENWDTKQ